MKVWVYGAVAVSVLSVSVTWGYKAWHVYQYCKMSSEQLVCTRVGEPGMTFQWCEGDYETGLSNVKRLHQAGLVTDRVQEFLRLSKTEKLYEAAMPKARELAYRKCMVESL
ncbi:hypothetical protein [Aeromonas allosaccharophila]|uniref:hypothetical protein n=1 Tax=Aeromonas allosaccharophila TaxID=656 RepID=UPI003D233671